MCAIYWLTMQRAISHKIAECLSCSSGIIGKSSFSSIIMVMYKFMWRFRNYDANFEDTMNHKSRCLKITTISVSQTQSCVPMPQVAPGKSWSGERCLLFPPYLVSYRPSALCATKAAGSLWTGHTPCLIGTPPYCELIRPEQWPFPLRNLDSLPKELWI
jgi:hypothetical protein